RLARVLKLLAPVAILVGLLHVVLGLRTDVMLGAKLPVEVISDPVLDSQNRFYGMAFAGYGALLLLCASDLRKYTALFRVVAAAIFLGGVARLIAMALHGAPTPPVLGLMAIELFAVPPLVWWHARVVAVPPTT
ncbi:MAG: DUF4345 domain-containing protein, partial [Myxococcales bacterium]|nr:DUF4345 domain-containing protein [Myxococcales bacterium]